MSAATASRALRGLKVHKKYQGKAEAAAAELGYVLNEAARSLRSVRTMTVGMVYHDLSSMLGMELLRSIAAGLDELGYSLFVSTAQGKNDHFDQLVHRFLQRRVDALVCVHSNGEGAALEGFERLGIPVMALITKAGGYSRLPMVTPTVEGAAEACIARLKELGHKAIGVVALERPLPPVESFMATVKAKRLTLIRENVSRDGFDAKATLRKLMNLSLRPTVVVALQAEATKLHEAATAMKIKIPKDLSIVAIRDRSAMPAIVSTAFSTIHLNPAIMGELATDILKGWLADEKALTRDRRVEIGSWIERDTTGPAAG